MILLDTTVLVYAKGEDHPLRQPCRALIAAVAGDQIHATTTVEVIREFAHVRARRRNRHDAALLASDYAELLSPLLIATTSDLERGLQLFARHESLGAFDAVLAACTIRNGVEALVSADTGFAGVPGVAHVMPDAAGLDMLIP